MLRHLLYTFELLDPFNRIKNALILINALIIDKLVSLVNCQLVLGYGLLQEASAVILFHLVLLYVFEFHEARHLVHRLGGGVHDVDEVLRERFCLWRAWRGGVLGFAIGVSKPLSQRNQIVLAGDAACVGSQSFEVTNHVGLRLFHLYQIRISKIIELLK